MPIEGVVADANVLLSAVVGKAALRVFTEFNVIVHVAHSITLGSIPRSSTRPDSDVGWVESFGVAQDRLRDTHHLPTAGIGALRLHPPYNFARRLFSVIPRSLLRGASFAGYFFHTASIKPLFSSSRRKLESTTLAGSKVFARGSRRSQVFIMNSIPFMLT